MFYLIFVNLQNLDRRTQGKNSKIVGQPNFAFKIC